MTNKQIIEEWLEARNRAWNIKESDISFSLPNGHYGRPYEGGWCITSIAETEDKLTLFIGSGMKLSLIFYGSVQVGKGDEESHTYLVLSGFRRLELHDYEGLTVFDQGEVKLYSTHTYKERGLQ